MSIVAQVPRITLTPVTSSQIAAIGFCAETSTLAVQFFHNGAPGNAYHYQNFTADDYAAFSAAESVGKHFYKHIKPFGDKYPYRNMGVPTSASVRSKLSKELMAIALNGRKYGSEITKEEEAAAKAAGLVVIFGASDDLMEFRGAAHDEIGAYDGGTAFIDRLGLLPDRDSLNDEGDEALKLYFARQPGAKQVDALWAAEEGYSWTFKTVVPHATFEVVEGGASYCRGIVIDLADLAPVAP